MKMTECLFRLLLGQPLNHEETILYWSLLRYLLRRKWLNFLVYPVLSPEGQKEWEQIEEALYREELTMQGYNKYRRVLFQKENLIPQDGTENEKPSDDKKDTEALVGAMSSDAGDHTAQKSDNFHSKEDCSKVNKKLCSAHESVLTENCSLLGTDNFRGQIS